MVGGFFMQAVLLAAGLGSRMLGTCAKCTEKVLDIPIIIYLLNILERAGIKDIIIVVGHAKEEVMNVTNHRYTYVFQEKPTGTKDALTYALPYIKEEVIVLPADTFILDESVISRFVLFHRATKTKMSILTVEKDNPYGYGRVVYEGKIKIYEEQEGKYLDCKECNTGIYIFNDKLLGEKLSKMNSEYLTKICECYEENDIHCMRIFEDVVLGINTPSELMATNRLYSKLINAYFEEQGVRIERPLETRISPDSILEQGVYIESGAIIYHSRIGRNTKILGNTRIIDSGIGSDNVIEDSILESACIGTGNKIGPFAHFRMNADIGNYNRIGNFVEIKDSMIASHTNVAHLAYIGNCQCGSRVNFGCGSITVNFDGKKKHQTFIKDGAFIGCNSNLIAPIVIHENGFVAAGSTITSNVDEDSLAIARARQITKEGYFKHKRQPPV